MATPAGRLVVFPFRRASGVAGVAVVVLVAACGQSPGVDDAGAADAAVGVDAGSFDAGTFDAGGQDAGEQDGGGPDASSEVDAGPCEGCLEVGVACETDLPCASGACVDGVCCEDSCKGTCVRCDVSGFEGTCVPVEAGADPDEECEADDSLCGRTGSCSGTNECAYVSSESSCGVASCESGGSVAAGRCAGAGTCVEGARVACAPYVCESASGLCVASCQGSGECVDGFSCVSGACLKDSGSTCTVDGECASGFCTDGFCCEQRCDGTCERCDLVERAGHCDPLPVGVDPDEECAAQSASTCGFEGNCSGSRACAFHPPATPCTTASCGGTQQSLPADLCDGFGNCVDTAPVACGAYRCDAVSGACRNSCATNSDCASGFECASGSCKLSSGSTCDADVACASGFCTDGVCCGSRCDGTCERCNQSGRAGSCDALPAGTDADNECATQAASTCGTTGSCSGARSCALFGASTVCAAASCTGAQQSSPADLCDGAGRCVDTVPATACGNYNCATPTGLCRTTCAFNADCATGFSCASGTCKVETGASCTADSQCATGFCTDGVCCSGRCDGTCEACNQAGSRGSCAPVVAGQDPENECATSSTSSCGTSGSCSGARSCAVYGAATVCAPATCIGTQQSTPANLCDGAGTCVNSVAVACGNYSCSTSTGLCRTSCVQNADCVNGFSCSGGGTCKKNPGSACGSDQECATGFCADSVCCQARCGGTCERCNLAGRAGFCDAIPFGQDPDLECAGALNCTGARSCQ